MASNCKSVWLPVSNTWNTVSIVLELLWAGSGLGGLDMEVVGLTMGEMRPVLMRKHYV